MPFTLTMPKLSPTMEMGTIVKWYKKEGELVEAGEVLMEVATDKATVEHEVLDEGWLRKILIPEGEEAQVNRPIAIFTEEKEESIEGYQIEEPTIEEEKPVLVLAENGSEKKEEVTAAASVSAPKGAGIMQPAFVPEQPLESYEFEMPINEIGKRIKASPLARRLAKEEGLDLTTVKGTGPGHRIMVDDLDRAQKSGIAAFGHREIPKVKPGSYEEEKMSPMRRVIAQRLQEAKTFIPHFFM